MTDQHLKEQQLTSELVFAGKLLRVRRDTVQLPNGANAIREYVNHPGAVTIIALLNDNKLVFERQFRYPLNRVFLELPAGKIDPGEENLATAIRELREETGFEAGEWQHLGTIHPCIGYSDERIEIFLARHLNQVGHALDDEEFLEVVTLTLDEAVAAVREGQITDAKTISALFWAEKVLKGDWPVLE